MAEAATCTSITPSSLRSWNPRCGLLVWTAKNLRAVDGFMVRFLFNKQGALGCLCVQHGIDQIDAAALAGQFLEIPTLGSLRPAQDAFGAATIAFGHDEMKNLSARRTAHGVNSIRVDQLKNVVVSVTAVQALQR
jgi:hypothetical protein